MQSKIAKLISYLFHPIFLPLFFLLIVFSLPVYPFSFYNSKIIFYLIILILSFNIFIPLLIILIAKKLNLVSSLSTEKREERFLIIIIYTIATYITFKICKSINLPPLWVNVLLLNILISLFTLLSNYFIKISLHLTGWGSLIGLLFYISLYFPIEYFNFLLITILISGFTAWARVFLNKHKATEIIYGFIVGVSIMFFGLKYLFIM